MTAQGEENTSSVIPDWWSPPVSKSYLGKLLLFAEFTRRIDDNEDIIDTIKQEAQDIETSDRPTHQNSPSSKISLTGVRRQRFGTLYYKWDCKEATENDTDCTETNWVVDEKVYMSSTARLLYAVCFGLTAIVSLSPFLTIPSINKLFAGKYDVAVLFMQVILLMFCLLATLLIFNVMKTRNYSIIESMERGYRLNSNSYVPDPVIYQVMLIFFSFIIISYGDNLSTERILFGSILGIGVLLLAIGSCIQVVRSKSPFLNDISLSTNLHTSGNLLSISIFSFGSIILLDRFNYFSQLIEIIGANEVLAGFGVVSISIVSSFGAWSILYTHSHIDSITARWKRNTDIRNISTKTQITAAAMTTLLVYGGLWSLRTMYMRLIHIPTTVGQQLSWADIVVVIFMIVLLLPPTYLIIGLIRQTYRGILYLKDVRQLIRSGTRLEDVRNGWDENVKYPVIVVDSTLEDEATAVEAFGQKAIVISRSVQGNIKNDQELAAILAHEEAHLEHGDTRIRSIAPFVGTLLGLSNAVIYAILDFRKREYRADAYACQKESPEDLLNGLNNIRGDHPDGSESEEENNLSHLRGNPGVVGASEEESSIFYPLFSNYTISSHPILDERKKAIDPSRQNPPDAEDIQSEF